MGSLRSRGSTDSTQIDINMIRPLPFEPTRVHKIQRVVLHIREPIESLRIKRIGNKRIWRQESLNRRIINPPLHIDEAEFGIVFVTGVAGLHWALGKVGCAAHLPE